MLSSKYMEPVRIVSSQFFKIAKDMPLFRLRSCLFPVSIRISPGRRRQLFLYWRSAWNEPSCCLRVTGPAKRDLERP